VRGVWGESSTWQGVFGKSNSNAGVVGEANLFHGVDDVLPSGLYYNHLAAAKASIFSEP
jgi:hypothetical protein